MDVQMPGMDGLAATCAIRALPGATGRVRIVGATADAMRGDRERFLAAGMDDVLMKPFNRASLQGKLSEGRTGDGGRALVPAPRDAHAASERPTVDAEAWAELVGDVGEAAARRIADSFASDLRRSLPSIAAAVRAGDLVAGRTGAHRLASAAGNLGFARLAAGLSALDGACRGDEGAISEALDEVEAAARDLEAVRADDRSVA